MSDFTQVENSVSPKNELALSARHQRLEDAMHLRRPDRIPVFPLAVNYYPTRSNGISNMDALASPEKTFDILRDVTIRHDWDAAASCIGTLVAFRPLEILGIKRVKWPGGGLSENQPYKWVESEYMLQSEYDDFLFDPTGFVLKMIWPRISSTLAPVCERLQYLPSSFLHAANPLMLPILIGDMFSTDEMAQFIAKAKELAEENKKNRELIYRYNEQMTQLGYPLYPPVTTYTAFDWLSTHLRGLRGILMDMYEIPDKLSVTLKFITQAMLKNIAGDSKGDGARHREIFIRMNHNAAELMSEDQFMRFYWPHLKSLVNGLVDTGVTPVLVFDGDYTSILHLLMELPPGKTVGHFKEVDRKKARELIGGVMCFWGNVPAGLLQNGTVQEVKDDVKALIDMFGDDGGLIIDGDVGIPDGAKPENVQAMTEAAHEYGVFEPAA